MEQKSIDPLFLSILKGKWRDEMRHAHLLKSFGYSQSRISESVKVARDSLRNYQYWKMKDNEHKIATKRSRNHTI